LAHLVPAAYLPKQLAGSSIFVLTDYGRIWNQDYPPEPTDRGASFAAGVKILVIGKFTLELGAATPIIKPEYVSSNEHWRFILSTAGHF
jgi:hemolysin activation/secretion protein